MTGEYHIGFVIEQVLGHITHGQNLRRNVARDSSIIAHWGLVPWEAEGWAARVPFYRSNWTVRAGLGARRLVAGMARQSPLDALFFHTQVTAMLAGDWLRRIPSVVSLDATPKQYDSLGVFYKHPIGSAWLEDLKWKLHCDCFQSAHHLVTWSAWAKVGLMADYGVPADKVTVIPPGVNVREWLRPSPRLMQPGPCRILFVGGNLERKGGHLLLDAFRQLRVEQQSANGHSDQAVELHIVTRDPLAEEPGLFVYNDLQPNSTRLKQLYHDCDIFCLPTSGDCLPMVLSEAGAAGLPVVSTRVAAIPEIVREGESGLLIPPGDRQALLDALRLLIEEPAQRLHMGQRAVELVSAKYDAERNAQQLLRLLKRVAVSNPTRG